MQSAEPPPHDHLKPKLIFLARRGGIGSVACTVMSCRCSMILSEILSSSFPGWYPSFAYAHLCVWQGDLEVRAA